MDRKNSPFECTFKFLYISQIIKLFYLIVLILYLKFFICINTILFFLIHEPEQCT